MRRRKIAGNGTTPVPMRPGSNWPGFLKIINVDGCSTGCDLLSSANGSSLLKTGLAVSKFTPTLLAAAFEDSEVNVVGPGEIFAPPKARSCNGFHRRGSRPVKGDGRLRSCRPPPGRYPLLPAGSPIEGMGLAGRCPHIRAAKGPWLHLYPLDGLLDSVAALVGIGMVKS